MHLINLIINYLYINMGFPFIIFLNNGPVVQATLSIFIFNFVKTDPVLLYHITPPYNPRVHINYSLSITSSGSDVDQGACSHVVRSNSVDC